MLLSADIPAKRDRPTARQRLRNAVLLPPSAYYNAVHIHDEADVADWWMDRWLSFNLFVFINGIISAALLILFTSLPPYPWARQTGWPNPFVLLFLPLILPVGANFAYLLGPTAHFVVGFIRPVCIPRAGPMLLRLGIGFSFFVVYLPSVAQAGHWLNDVCCLIYS